ncbi:MAG TPA: ABC transporter ATP-binding protein [Anaerolineae bacterium]|nr:ABC transporter ATP-binding protein [Anaerolineae bacterium]HQJ52680.1 ABC transporter ATP-binding protein [Anaerolineae bacterium]
MSQAPAVSLSEVSFGYGASPRPALSQVSLEIPAGRITAILGPNGSGKTTLLRLLLGVLQPVGGQILLGGRARSAYSRAEQSRLVGLVPQSEHVPFDFTVLEYVLLGRAPYLGPLDLPGPEDRAIAREALETVGIGHLAERAVPNLSGGERQLATIARTLAQAPALVLLDEPTAHLDLGNQSRLLQIMRDLRDAGGTLLVTTHDPDLAASVADLTVLMKGGQVLCAGQTEAVLTAEWLTRVYETPILVYRVDGHYLICLA